MTDPQPALEARLNGLNRRIWQLGELSSRLIHRALTLTLAAEKRRAAAELRTVDRRIAELKIQAAAIKRQIAVIAAGHPNPERRPPCENPRFPSTNSGTPPCAA